MRDIHTSELFFWSIFKLHDIYQENNPIHNIFINSIIILSFQIPSEREYLKSGSTLSGRTYDLLISVRKSLNGSSGLIGQLYPLCQVLRPLGYMQKLGEKQEDPQPFHSCRALIKRVQHLQGSGYHLFGLYDAPIQRFIVSEFSYLSFWFAYLKFCYDS